VRAGNVQDTQTASVEVVIYESTGHDYTTYTYELKGSFSKAGAATSAEGDILQVSFLAQIVLDISPSRDFFLLKAET
jgi:E3 ubiquitin-protein ligase ZNRF3